jgi:hypothetical protein
MVALVVMGVTIWWAKTVVTCVMTKNQVVPPGKGHENRWTSTARGQNGAWFSLGEPCVTLWTDESMGLMIATCHETRSYDGRIVSLGQEKCNVALNHA